MGRPNLSRVVKRWQQPVTLKTVSKTTVDFETVEVVVSESIRATVQVADRQKLNLDSIDWSKKYFWFHTTSPLAVNQYVEYKGADYKLVLQGRDHEDYGYFAFAGEETKKPLLVAT